jgi:hypothetical protein
MVTQFKPSPDGRHRYLTLTAQQAIRAREAFAQLVSQPPRSLMGKSSHAH